MSPIAGFTRLRKHQFGLQSAFGTPVAATRAYPFSGVPSVNLNWTDPEVDAGSIDPVAAPYRQAPDITAALTAPSLYYDDLPLMLSAIFGGAVTPTGAGTAKTWAYAPASVDPLDDFDSHTYQFGDDVTDDWFELADGILESLNLTSPEGLGAMSSAMTWRFGNARSTGSTDSTPSGTVPTASLDVDIAGIPVYAKDASLFIASSTAGLSGGQISDALHTFELRIGQPVDQKRFINGTQTFDVQDYGRQARSIEIDLQFAKTSDTVGTGSEADAWFSDDAVNRWVEIKFVSTIEADTGVPYSLDLVLPLRYYTRADGNIGGNTTVTLTGHAFYDADDLAGAITVDVVNKLAAL